MKRLLIVLALAGCGADELNASTNSKTQEVPVVATGTVSGQVLDEHGQPLAEARVGAMVDAANPMPAQPQNSSTMNIGSDSPVGSPIRSR